MARIATIVLTVVFHFALGAIYFSPEYGVARAWIAANDVDPKVMEASQFPVKPFAVRDDAYFFVFARSLTFLRQTAFVSAVAYAFAVALVFGRSYSRLEATLHVFVFWVALHVLPTFTNVMFVGTVRAFAFAVLRLTFRLPLLGKGPSALCPRRLLSPDPVRSLVHPGHRL